MATNENTSQINTFTEGMNMDQAFDSIKASQYRYALNVRMINIIEGTDADPSIKSGILSPLYTYKCSLLHGSDMFTKDDKDNINKTDFHVYKTLQSGDYIIVLYSNCDSDINVGRIVEGTNGTYEFIKLCSLKFEQVHHKKPNISAVLHYEQTSVVNLYIADGEGKIILINIADQEYLNSLKIDNTDMIEAALLRQNNYFPSNKVTILGLTSGQLKTSQVQYTYRFYKKHGNCSKLAPLTNKIQIINPSRDSETGNAEDTVTSLGLKLQINDSNIKQFDSIQIYRLQYIKAEQNAETSLIYDGLVTKINNDVNFTYIDDGKASLQDLSMEEFSGLDGLSIIPEVIEQNQNYLFAGNVKDETIINIESATESIVFDEGQKIEVPEYLFTTYQFKKVEGGYSICHIHDGKTVLYNYEFESQIAPWYQILKDNIEYKEELEYGYFSPMSDINNDFYIATDRFSRIGGEGPCINWNLILYKGKPGQNESITKYRVAYNQSNNSYILVDVDDSEEDAPIPYEQYFKNQKIPAASTISYDNNFTSSVFRSLKRGEVYRYGIVFFNSHGNRTNVQWIADVKVPYMNNIPFIDDGNTNIIGVEFTLNENKLRNLIGFFDIVGYEIVRCAKPDVYSRCLDQVATSTVVQQHLPRKTDTSPYYPTGLITSQPQKIVYSPKAERNHPFPEYMTFAESSKDDNILLQLYSPQIQIQRKDMFQKLKSAECKLHPIVYQYTDNGDILKPSFEITDDNITADYIDNDSAYSDFSKTNLKKDIVASAGPVSFYFNDTYLRNKETVYIGTPDYGSWLYFNVHFLDLTKESKLVSSYLYDYGKSTNSLSIINTSKWAEKSHVNTPASIALINTFIDDIEYNIKNIIDVKDITWENGFSNHTYNGSSIKTAVKKYKSYISTISNSQYVNWVCSNKYNLPIGTNNEAGWTQKEITSVGWAYGFNDTTEFTNATGADYHQTRDFVAIGPIGPGGQCFIVNISGVTNKFLFTNVVFPTQLAEKIPTNKQISAQNLNNYDNHMFNIGTLVCDITHTALQFAGTSKEDHNQDIYYGFGNYYKTDTNSVDVFDGDTYINNCEFVGMFKAYDFNDDKSSLQSLQTVFRIPMESKINQLFDYGQNYRNTNNPNLQLEPGTISNITSQERALNQYNLIYSDNDTSNNMYNVDNSRDTENKFEQRVFYSQLKTNGENIDSWQTFKAANFIDVNSKYGILTDMLTVDDQLYFWQQYAFGKFSVNERSLVKDENSNTIQLGQGDVLQRCDYISTDYGMRKYDMCKIAVDSSIFWYDNHNNCIVKYGSEGQYYKQTGCTNYSEQKLVKSCFRDSEEFYEKHIPTLTYNKDYSELIFSPVTDPEYSTRMLAFNTKYNIASSFYSFDDDYIENVLYQYKKDCFYLRQNNNDISICNFQGDKSTSPRFSSSLKLEFVINKSPSTTKVFDNQQIVFGLKFQNVPPKDTADDLFKNTDMYFETDLGDTNTLAYDEYIATNREGNVCYPIPRDNNDKISRLRGKWMKQTVIKDEDTDNFTISHIITKFRQSYS